MIWSWWLIYFSLAAQRAVASPTVSRLTDTTKFTGSHKERFDQTGRGKGKAGRVDMVDTSGYVSGYKHAGSYEKKVQGKPQQKPVWNLSLNHPQNPIPSTDKARGGESKAQQDHICYFCLFISIFFFFSVKEISVSCSVGELEQCLHRQTRDAAGWYIPHQEWRLSSYSEISEGQNRVENTKILRSCERWREDEQRKH